jgi:hypothetical protein
MEPSKIISKLREITYNEYDLVVQSPECVSQTVEICDHINGFDLDYNNLVLDALNRYAIKTDQDYEVIVHNPLMPAIHARYNRLKFFYRLPYYMFRAFQTYRTHPDIDYKNFICTFNGSAHVSRKLLTAHLHKLGFYNPDYASKNFSTSNEELDGILDNLVGDNSRFYRKFFITDDDFLQSINGFGHNTNNRLKHHKNIFNLETPITQSFVHLVSESMSTSYHPFVTEKPLYSIVTRGLFVVYGQPRYYDYFEHHFGFKKYDRIFDYSFDQIDNPVERLVALTDMLSKFKNLTTDDWQDLYQMEQDTIEYNYDNYFSGNYLKQLELNTCPIHPKIW